jgi:hypothetical protein
VLYEDLETRTRTDVPPQSGPPASAEVIGENYRQLVLNYEKRRDYDTAEDFHIGEMEARRRKQLAILNVLGRKIAQRLGKTEQEGVRYADRVQSALSWLNGYGLYGLLSRYGTSYWQAFLVLIALAAIFATGFMFTGLQATDPTVRSSEPAIEYDLGIQLPFGYERPSVAGVLRDWSKGLILCGAIVTLQVVPCHSRARWSGGDDTAGGAPPLQEVDGVADGYSLH